MLEQRRVQRFEADPHNTGTSGPTDVDPAPPEKTPTVGDRLGPMLEAIFERPPAIRFELWDGSVVGPRGNATVRIKSPVALRRLLWAPRELGLARAYVCGEIDIVGCVAEVLKLLQDAVPDRSRLVRSVPAIVKGVRHVGALGGPPPRLAEEMIGRGPRHSIRRDRRAVQHHYDVGNDFYELVLGDSMTYSCARFSAPDANLDEAQTAKHELVCRKLGLAESTFRSSSRQPRPRVLDVGCGWGAFAAHAAAHHEVDVVGITLSEEQAAFARRHVARAGLADRVDVRVQDYRTVDDGPYDAIASVGMAEHVGRDKLFGYVDGLAAQLRPGGRFLNHAIASIGGSRPSSRSFVGRFVFPDGELPDLAHTVDAFQQAALEVRDVENLREHYAHTLRAWVTNLEQQWDRAVELVGERRARIWLLYMSGAVNGFDDAGLMLFQTLGVRSERRPSDVPRTRREWD